MKAAAYTGTRNLYSGMVPAVKSLLAHSDVEKVYLLIEDDEFPYYLPDCVETVNVSNQTYFRPGGPNMDSDFTYMAMMRATFALMFTELDRILSLDVDTIVNEDISILWDAPLNDCYFCAAPEWHKTKPDRVYTNIGVCMYNLEKLRDGKAQQAIDALNTRKYRFLEQDVFNEICQGHILLMNGNYNANYWVKHGDNPKIVHYAAIRDWEEIELVKQYRQMEWIR